ncbi:putative quinol monooxygenase [Flavobacterium sp. A45]|uniref:putative quinol monooxygenase n=1 Tax=Flavobacterium sp. A45 TaxID=1945862 RepID=UPI000985EBCD|nr:putative quinol monooxygenase [Flavobacterium sp. A45]OOG68838.1 antibiotic biosynthesis monooxygenase [Flavobacterium sp. A45]
MKIRNIDFIKFTFTFLALVFFEASYSQNKNQIVRLAKLVINPEDLKNYQIALKEEIETSIKIEPGVLTLYAVSERDNPNHITILEIYKDRDSYNLHIKTPHFIKYKDYTKDMVKSLELIETDPLIPEMKIK